MYRPSYGTMAVVAAETTDSKYLSLNFKKLKEVSEESWVGCPLKKAQCKLQGPVRPYFPLFS